ncbi:hypothetical protein Tco_1468575 [Tanacetum coccineum]
MSSASSAVTYTSVYTDSELRRVFWGADEELSDGGSPRVIVYGYDGLPMQPVAPPSSDYIPLPEEPQTPPVPQDEDEREPMFIQPHDPDYVPEPMYPKYIPLEDKHVFLAEEQPLPSVVSPTAESPRYVIESDLEEDPEEYEGDETKDGPVDYPMDGREDGDDDDGGSHGDDADDEDEDEEDEDGEDEEEEEEHLAPTDSAVVVPTVELVSSPKGTEPVTPPPSTDITTTGARITVRLQASISLPPEAEVERLLAMPTPPPSPPISISPPSAGERLARPQMLKRDDEGLERLGYNGIRDTWEDPAKAVPKIAPNEDSHIIASHYGLAAGRLTYGGYDSSSGDNTVFIEERPIMLPRGLGSNSDRI